jgi:molybdate transport system substrate-binding protein
MYIRRRLLRVVVMAAVLVSALMMVGSDAAPTLAATNTTTIKVSATNAPTKKTTAKSRPTKTTKTTTTRSKKPTTTVPTTAPPTMPTTRATTSTIPLTGPITVFAATSLTAAFTDMAAAFMKAHPGVTVTLNFAGSSTLVTQIVNGAPADVFASADVANMDKLVNAKLIDATPMTFTRNTLMIVTGKGNPLRVKTLADLGRSEVFVALGAPGVPVGDYARQVLANAGVSVTPKTLESNVAAIVNKAALREIDAGIVYVTDVAIDDYRVDGIAIPPEQNVIATYPVAALSTSANKATAAGFVAFAQSPVAQAILAKYKFLPLK